jgi:hypothetical protein
MMTKISRLAGAILLERAGEYFLIGNTKEPCDWQKAGFAAPQEVDAVKQPFIPLTANREIGIAPLHLTIASEAPAAELAQVLANRFLIRRNGSVSERLWRVVTGESDETGPAAAQPIEATWLVTMPERIWDVVRDTVLKCL